MKSLLTIASIFIFSHTIYAQSFIKINVPMVTENKKVDSLIDVVLKRGVYETFCIRIHIIKFTDHYRYDLFILKVNPENLNLGYEAIGPHMMIPVPNVSLRYFSYKGILGFISGAYEPSGPFKLTKTFKTFKFYINETEKKFPESRIIYGGYYNFINGDFVNDAIGNR